MAVCGYSQIPSQRPVSFFVVKWCNFMCCCTGQPVTLRKILNIWLCYDSVRLLLDTIIEARQFFCCEVCTLRAIPSCSTSIPAWIGTTNFIIQVNFIVSGRSFRSIGTLFTNSVQCGVHKSIVAHPSYALASSNSVVSFACMNLQ